MATSNLRVILGAMEIGRGPLTEDGPVSSAQHHKKGHQGAAKEGVHLKREHI